MAVGEKHVIELSDVMMSNNSLHEPGELAYIL